MSKVSNPLRTQGRVIWALALRETKTLFGYLKLGYLWEIILTAFGVGVFWGIRSLIGFSAPQGMNAPLFLISGFTIWNIFHDSINKSIGAIGSNKALLTYPQVFPLDIIMARVFVIWTTHLLVMFILLSFASFIGYSTEIVDMGKFVLTLVFCYLMGVGLGSFFSSLNLLWPSTSKLIAMAMRILFFVSGVFYEPTRFEKYIGDLFIYNPALLLIEMFRGSFSEIYVSVDISLDYLISFVFSTIFWGLLMERFARRRVE